MMDSPLRPGQEHGDQTSVDATLMIHTGVEHGCSTGVRRQQQIGCSTCLCRQVQNPNPQATACVCTCTAAALFVLCQ